MAYLWLKRAMDVAGSLAGLAFTALVYLPVALAIKLDSSGPVLFAQDRVGQHERTFRMYKFRTMYPGAAGSGTKPDPGDERVTRTGRWLRRTSVDELPQFYNVLRGEMSLVGPRPEQARFAARYEAWQRQRFTVKPGLTGWWQVNGRRQPMHEHVADDIYYVEHRSLRLDLLIVWRTWAAIVNGRGAV